MPSVPHAQAARATTLYTRPAPFGFWNRLALNRRFKRFQEAPKPGTKIRTVALRHLILRNRQLPVVPVDDVDTRLVLNHDGTAEVSLGKFR
jgi:hypothetical protein